MGKHLEQALAFCVCTPVPNWLLLINVDNSAGRGTSYAILYLECYPNFGVLPLKFHRDHTLSISYCIEKLISINWKNFKHVHPLVISMNL